MDERLREIGAVVVAIAGGAATAYGLLLIGDAYTTMQQIEALGAVGQFTAEEQYSQATSDFRTGLLATIGGLVFVVAGLFENAVAEIKRTLRELN